MFWYWLVPRRSQVGFLDKASKTKTKAFAKYKKHWTGAAGDNMAEGLISAVKQTARRLGSIHGGRLNEGGRQKALAARSSAALLRCSGLWNVLHAVKVFRESCSSGLLPISPTSAFQLQKHAWLVAQGP
jgi:hypothetical protein